MAAGGARPAAGEAADHWVPGRGYVFIIWPMGRRFCTAAARTRLDRGSHHETEAATAAIPDLAKRGDAVAAVRFRVRDRHWSR